MLENATDETDISSLFNGDDGAPNYLFQEEPLADQYNDTGNGSIRYKVCSASRAYVYIC